jgi:predicted RNase H-like HicB family nuclease
MVQFLFFFGGGGIGNPKIFFLNCVQGVLGLNINITVEVWQKEKWFVAKCPELDFVSQGKTRNDAKANLLEVIRIQIEEMDEMGTLDEYLAECGYERSNDQITPLTEMIGFEKYSLQ